MLTVTLTVLLAVAAVAAVIVAAMQSVALRHANEAFTDAREELEVVLEELGLQRLRTNVSRQVIRAVAVELRDALPHDLWDELSGDTRAPHVAAKAAS